MRTDGRTERRLALLLIFLVVSVVGIRAVGSTGRHARWEEMTAAAARMEACEAALKEERLRRGVPLSEEDYLEIGLIGLSSSAITTTVGSPEAKRTSELPDMAAMCVRILDDAGLRRGDTIGACYSGSFPGLNLALICAADAMGIEIRYIASIGASSYGANVPEFTSPEMLYYLYESGMISEKPLAVTLGGDEDRGDNMLANLLDENREELKAAVGRLTALGLAPVIPESYAEDLAWRLELYGGIDGFVNVGGNVAGMGKDGQAYGLGQGILSDSGRKLEKESGLLEHYLREGIPAIQLLNLKQLCLEYGIAYDPAVKPEIGQGAVYYVRAYPKGLIAAAAFLAAAGLLRISCGKKIGDLCERLCLKGKKSCGESK